MTNMRLARTSFSAGGEHGYVLLTLLLFMATLVIVSAAVAPAIARQIQRDREEELIHRGMEYRRAIRRFIKQTGRYPSKLEDLDTGTLRYLRKRYKDPITGLEFRPLHMLDIPRIGGPIPNPSRTEENGAENSSPNTSAATISAATRPDQTDPAADQAPKPTSTGASQTQNAQATATSISQQPANFGGGVIIGVVSTSTKKTIREFNHKSHYNQWLFYYDPAYDRVQETYGPTPSGQVLTALQGSPGLNTQMQPAAQK